jgi:hypothetical protein
MESTAAPARAIHGTEKNIRVSSDTPTIQYATNKSGYQVSLRIVL